MLVTWFLSLEWLRQKVMKVPTNFPRFCERLWLALFCMQISSQTLRQQMVRYIVNPLPRKDRKMSIFAYSIFAETLGTVNVHPPVKNYLFVFHNPASLEDARPIDFQRQVYGGPNP